MKKHITTALAVITIPPAIFIGGAYYYKLIHWVLEVPFPCTVRMYKGEVLSTWCHGADFVAMIATVITVMAVAFIIMGKLMD